MKQLTEWFSNRGIHESTLKEFDIQFRIFNEKIAIPIHNPAGELIFRKYRKSPLVQNDEPKYTYDKGSNAALFNAHRVTESPVVIICEGELDAILLWEMGYKAVSSTGGSGTFKDEWVPFFANKDVYVIYDHDEAGYKGAYNVQSKIPHAKIVWLPAFVKEHGDITDYFAKGGTRETFDDLLSTGKTYDMSKIPEEENMTKKRRNEIIKIYKERIDAMMEEKHTLDTPERAQPYIDIQMGWREEHKRKLKLPAFKPMADIDDDFTKRIEIAKQVPLENFVQFNRQGFTKSVYKPNERTPSMFYYRKENRYHCFAEGRGGDVIDYIQEEKGVGFNEAVDFLTGNSK